MGLRPHMKTHKHIDTLERMKTLLDGLDPHFKVAS